MDPTELTPESLAAIRNSYQPTVTLQPVDGNPWAALPAPNGVPRINISRPATFDERFYAMPTDGGEPVIPGTTRVSPTGEGELGPSGLRHVTIAQNDQPRSTVPDSNALIRDFRDFDQSGWTRGNGVWRPGAPPVVQPPTKSWWSQFNPVSSAEAAPLSINASPGEVISRAPVLNPNLTPDLIGSTAHAAARFNRIPVEPAPANVLRGANEPNAASDVRGSDAVSKPAASETAISNAIGRARTVDRASPDASSAGYNRGSDSGAGELGGVVHTPDPEVAQIWQKGGISAPPFHETTPQDFATALGAAKQASPHGAAVTLYPDYNGMKTFVTPDRSAGFALNDGDIISVFRHPDSPHTSVTPAMLDLAVGQGGNRLDAFDTQLPRIYSRSGFRAVARIPWSDAYAPEGWNPQTFGQHNGGKPDVVFMVHDPEYNGLYNPGEGQQVGSYEEGQAAQQTALSKISQRQDKLAGIQQDVPGLDHVMKFMTPDEIAKVKGQNAQKLVNLFQSFPEAEEMASVAYSGRAKRGWYENSARALQNIFGVPDSRRFASLLAATSPQSSVESNAANALSIWNNWVSAGRPTDRNSIIRVMGQSVQGTQGGESILPAWINNTVTALSHPDPGSVPLSGPKVSSFANNLRGMVNDVTNDTWMANYAGKDPQVWQKTGPSPGKSVGYMAGSARARQAADILTKSTGQVWTPAEVQETVWSWAKALYEKGDRGGENRSMQDILNAGDLTHEEINSVPDFQKLFSDNIYRKLLEYGGYGDKLAPSGNAVNATQALRGSATSHEGSGIPQAAFAHHLSNAAKRLDALRAQRNAEKPSYELGDTF